MKFRKFKCGSCGQERMVVDGDEIRRLRNNLGLTLNEVGESVGFTAAYISDIEFNKRNPPPKLIKFFKIKP